MKLKKCIWTILLSGFIILNILSMPVMAAEPMVSEVVGVKPYDESELEINTRGVSVNTDFYCAVGKSWQKEFKPSNWLSEDHNAFKTKVTDVIGKYKVIINGSNGYSYESGEYSDVGRIFTTTNAKANVTYTITIVNTGASPCSGHVELYSYLEG